MPIPLILLALFGAGAGAGALLEKKLSGDDLEELRKEYYKCIQELTKLKATPQQIQEICMGWKVGTLTFAKTIAIAGATVAIGVGTWYLLEYLKKNKKEVRNATRV